MLCYDTTRYDLFMIPIPLGAVSGNSGSVSLLLLLDGMLVCDGEYQNIETLLRSRLRSNRTAHSGSNRRQATSSNQRPVMPRPTHCRRGEKEARYAVVRTSSIYRNEPCSVDGFSLSRSSWTYIHFVYVIYIFALYFTLKGILTFYDCGCRLQSVGGG